MQRQVIGDLQALTNSKSAHIESYLEHLRARAVDFSSDGFIRDTTAKILSGDSDALHPLINHLKTNKASLDPLISGITVYNTAGISVASTDKKEIGRNESADKYFIEAAKLDYGNAFTSDVHEHAHFGLTPSIATAAPLTNKDTGERLGVLVNYIIPSNLEIIVAGEGNTGLTCGRRGTEPSSYLLRGDGGLITGPCNEGDAEALKTHPGLQVCKSTSPSAYINHRGQSVTGSATCLQNGWVLIAELPTSIAFAGLAEIQKNIALAILFIIVLALIIIFFQIRALVRPLRQITHAAQQITEGNWEGRVEIKSKDEIGKLGTIFNHMIDRLRRVDKAKTEFVSIASHQLRTPLTTINWSTQALLDGDGGKLTKKQRPYFDNILHSSRSMNELVSALLNVSRIELGAYAVKPVKTHTGTLIKSLIQEIALMAKQAGITISTDTAFDPPIKVDTSLFRIVLHNVLTNAIKYSPKGSIITVTTKKSGKFIRISVEDQGVGIPKNDHAKMFTKFFRADNVRVKDVEGNGLGLYIVKEIITQVGGKIWFVSTEGKGTTFFLTLPLSGMKKKRGTKSLIAEGV